MKDDEGRVLIDRFYDGIAPLGDAEKQALAEMPKQDGDLRRELWLARNDGGGEPLEGLLNYPSLNIRGLASAGVGSQSRNVIPAQASRQRFAGSLAVYAARDDRTKFRCCTFSAALLREHVRRFPDSNFRARGRSGNPGTNPSCD